MKTFPPKHELQERRSATLTRTLAELLGCSPSEMRRRLERSKANLKTQHDRLLDLLLRELSVAEQEAERVAAALMAPPGGPLEEWIFEGLPQQLIPLIPVHGPMLLAKKEIRMVAELWWATRQSPTAPAKLKTAAKRIWEGIGKALAWNVGSGRREPTPEEKKAIVAAYEKWYPICKGLNKEFNKEEWKEKKLERSELGRKEKREELAEKYGVSAADVQAIEWLLEQPSGRRGNSTPTQATCHMVAREFPMIGDKTVEKIWGDYLDEHPEKRRKRRKSTTQAASHS